MKQKYYYSFFLGLCFFLSTFSAFAQPANNSCATATLITVGQTCQTVYTNVGATGIAPTGGNTCGGATAAASGVWFKFVATKATQRIYLSNYTPNFDPTFLVYSGTCGVGPLACTNGGGIGANETGDYTLLVPGDTYFIRVGSNTAARGNFCVQVYDPTPSNDDCADATPLVMNALCTNGSNNSATSNVLTDVNNCRNNSKTVWYSFVATSTKHQVYVKNDIQGGSFDVAYALYTGSCAGLQVNCINALGNSGSEFFTHTGLTIGTTYFIRVNGDGGSDVGNFCVRVFGPPPNDVCATAIPLPTNGTCVSGYTNAATSEAPVPSCVTGSPASVWYSFVATSAKHSIVLDVDNLASSSNEDLVFSVYSGSCGVLTELACINQRGDNGDEVVVGTITPGQTYFIQVAGSTTANQGTFCIKVLSPPPNDDCSTARNLTPNGTCVAGFNYNANAEAIGASCVDNSNLVWYSFVATSTVHTVQLTNVSVWADLAFRVLRSTGACGIADIGACRDGAGAGTDEILEITGLIVGQLYYVVVGGYTATDQGEFCIRIAAPPFNDLCQNARELVVNNPCFAANNIGATSDGTNPASSCANLTRTVWFKFRATATSQTLSLENREASGSNKDLNMTVYSTSDNTCSGTFSQVNGALGCIDNGGDLVGEGRILTGLTIGRMYYVMVSGDATNDEAQFCISVTNSNNLCANAVPIVANSECIAGSNIGATTTGATDGVCQTPEKTVWYSYTPKYSNATLIVDGNPGLDVEVTVFSSTGLCAGLGSIACVDVTGSGATETVALNTLIPGNLYYIMVDGQSNEGVFCISIKEPLACGSNPLPGNTCEDAPLISNLDGYCGFTSATYTPNFYNNVGSNTPGFCNGANTIENNSFLRFTADAQEVVLELNIVSSSANGGAPCDQGIQLQVYTVSGNDCTTGFWNPILPTCISPSGAVGSTQTVRLSNLVPGNVYYIMFDGYAGDECGFVIRAPFGGGVLLPLDLLEFNAKPLEYANQVNWKVVQDYSVGERFWVERSTNQMQFETLGELFHQNGKTAYQFLDETATEKRDYYYRLRTIDEAGKYHFSKTVLISENDEPKIDEKPILIYPNPTDKELNISLKAEQKTTVLIQVLDIQGKVIKEFSKNADKGINKFVVPTQNLQRGLYLIRIMDNLGTISYQEKFIKE